MNNFQTLTLLSIITAIGLFWGLNDPWRSSALGIIFTVYTVIFILGIARLKLNFFGPAICRGDTTENLVALTFDDGPDPEGTPVLLEALARHQIRAVFFPVGEKIKAHPDLIRRIDQEGHLIGNHSYRHRRTTNFLISGPLDREIKRAQEIIEKTIGKIPAYYRPPVGLTNPHLPRVLQKLGLSVVGWDVRPYDIGLSTDKVVKRIFHKMRPGSIILLHEQGRSPAEMSRLIDQLATNVHARGFRFTDPEKLIGKSAYQGGEKEDLKTFVSTLERQLASGSGWRRLLKPLAATLAASPYVQRASKEVEPLEIFKNKPGPKFFLGVGVMLFSYALGWPMVGLFTVLAGYFQNPSLLVIGPACYGLSHFVFLLGMFIAGRDCLKYSDALMRWFVQQMVGKVSGQET